MIISSEVFRLDILNAPLIDITRRKQADRNLVSNPAARKIVDVVVVGPHSTKSLCTVFVRLNARSW